MDKEIYILLLDIKKGIEDCSSVDKRQDGLLSKISGDVSDVRERVAGIDVAVDILKQRLCSPSIQCQDQEMVKKVSSLEGRTKFQSWLLKAVVGITIIAALGSLFGVLQSCHEESAWNHTAEIAR